MMSEFAPEPRIAKGRAYARSKQKPNNRARKTARVPSPRLCGANRVGEVIRKMFCLCGQIGAPGSDADKTLRRGVRPPHGDGRAREPASAVSSKRKSSTVLGQRRASETQRTDRAAGNQYAVQMLTRRAACRESSASPPF